MKKKIFSVAIVAAIALGAGWNVMQSENDMNLSDLALSNVEALADGLPECKYNRHFSVQGRISDGTMVVVLSCSPGGSSYC